MIKVVNASIALRAMLRGRKAMSLTQVAEVQLILPFA
jgi:hypothetical protein